MASIEKEFEKTGTILVDDGSELISAEKIIQTSDLASSLPLEHVIGDANEPNYLDVGRFITDVDRPTLVNRPSSDEALDIIKDADFQKFFVTWEQAHFMSEECNTTYLEKVVL